MKIVSSIKNFSPIHISNNLSPLPLLLLLLLLLGTADQAMFFHEDFYSMLDDYIDSVRARFLLTFISLPSPHQSKPGTSNFCLSKGRPHCNDGCSALC